MSLSSSRNLKISFTLLSRRIFRRRLGPDGCRRSSPAPLRYFFRRRKLFRSFLARVKFRRLGDRLATPYPSRGRKSIFPPPNLVSDNFTEKKIRRCLGPDGCRRSSPAPLRYFFSSSETFPIIFGYSQILTAGRPSGHPGGRYPKNFSRKIISGQKKFLTPEVTFCRYLPNVKYRLTEISIAYFSVSRHVCKLGAF
jgi:hypothetical protein